MARRSASADVKFTIDDVILPLHTRGRHVQVGDRPGGKRRTPTPWSSGSKQPFGPLMNALGYDFPLILPQAPVRGGTRHQGQPLQRQAGPARVLFKFVEWKKGSYVIPEKNKDYFVKGIPYLDRLVFQEIPDAAARVLALESGDIDYLAYQALPSSSVPRLKTNPKLVTSLDGFEALASIEILAFNLDNPQLKDVRVRHVIAYAIDKQVIADKADYGIGKAATGPISSLTGWAYEPNVSKYPHNPQKAAKLLEDAGFPVKRRRHAPHAAPSIADCRRRASIARPAKSLKEQLAQVGVKVDLQTGSSAMSCWIAFT